MTRPGAGTTGSRPIPLWPSASTFSTGRPDMGMFKDMRNLQKMGNDMRANMPSPAEQMANAQNRMANAQQMLANQTAAATAAARLQQGLADGTAIRATAVINSM